MELFIAALLLGLIPAAIASKKGGTFIVWWLYGSLLFIIAIIHALLMSPVGLVKCPECAEMVKKEAKVCKHCGRQIADQKTRPVAPEAEYRPEQ